MLAKHQYSRGQGNAQWCQLNVKPALVQGFALTPNPSPGGRGEQEI
ncbi:hypothetical protein NIES3275_00990 [Microchaete diplosiphon NIES-3275]|nr:hypothetical protein NIES3275_00990 [Microchaete diplosiphon NIES-3275]